MKTSVFIEIPADSQAHRQMVQRAIETRDESALISLKGRLAYPIHYVSNWFQYCLMYSDDRPEIVVIYSPSARQDMVKALSQAGHRAGGIYPAIPETTYDDIVRTILTYN